VQCYPLNVVFPHEHRSYLLRIAVSTIPVLAGFLWHVVVLVLEQNASVVWQTCADLNAAFHKFDTLITRQLSYNTSTALLEVPVTYVFAACIVCIRNTAADDVPANSPYLLRTHTADVI
jgi:hypothetical protein